MKLIINLIGTIAIEIAVAIACVGSYYSHDYQMPVMPAEPPVCEVITLQKVAVDMPPIPDIHYSSFEPEELFLNLSFEDMDLLEQIAMSEARGEGVKGMALVMNVVLNRSRITGDSIHDVIFAQGQFYTADMMAGSEQCHEALALVMDGWDESQGAYYFNKYGYRAGAEPLFQYGAHYFSK